MLLIGMDDPEQRNREAWAHVLRMRERLADGEAEIERQQASVSDTREHMADIQRWLAESRHHTYDDAA